MDLVGLSDGIATTAHTGEDGAAGTRRARRTTARRHRRPTYQDKRGGAMADAMRVMLEMGPHGKKVVAVAPDWPGLARGAKTEEAAIERLRSYVPRYAPVAALAGMDAAFATISTVDVVERYPGTGSTDFWGISFAFSSIDRQDISSEAMERELTLMQAC
jgi:hypothetical protein